MLYEKEYEESGRNKEKFIKIMTERFPNIKIKTIKNNWYILNAQKNTNINTIEEKEEIINARKPSILKMMRFEDIRKYNPNYTKECLFKYGFSHEDIEWLEKKYGKNRK